ncbi:MAG: RagB/SusD family nutrient uptake outer membrane protein [Bacteroidales bacterium]|nr:RagB/SusD family nutrient uptake outer membrane protein [Bacteroidales bacterium]
MKNIFKVSIALLGLAAISTGCIKEFQPQTSYVTAAQAAAAPGSFDNFVAAITSTMNGQFLVWGNDDTRPDDLGYPSLMITRDNLGSDLTRDYLNWYSNWYQVQYLEPNYAYCQFPWSYYYQWIKACNTVISLAGENPAPEQCSGVAQAYTMRAMFYLDLARWYSQKTYTADKEALTVPKITEKTLAADAAHNPRMTNEQAFEFILSDVDMAEKYFEGVPAGDVYTPNLSLAYGVKARAYLTMGEWEKAKEYAEKAIEGHAFTSAEQYIDWETGFNTPTSSWIFALKTNKDDPQILYNDADSSWGSMWCLEINPEVSGCGYAANYGQHFIIDRHLYESIPDSDIRKKCWIGFLDDASEDEWIDFLGAYSKHPDWLWISSQTNYSEDPSGFCCKFRTAGGDEGRDNQYVGFLVSIPLMRSEEMLLIQAEAAEMLAAGEGQAILTNFMKSYRDPSYVYGTHSNETFFNDETTAFQNEIYWQKRVELWGEGLSMFDTKRLEKGIIRSYAGTNHPEGERFNVDHTPEWYTPTIVQTETNYNYDCVQNPTPIRPSNDSEEYVW